jgi:hypothetical protein
MTSGSVISGAFSRPTALPLEDSSPVSTIQANATTAAPATTRREHHIATV